MHRVDKIFSLQAFDLQAIIQLSTENDSRIRMLHLLLVAKKRREKKTM